MSVTIEVHLHAHGGVQLSINVTDERGGGHGYRIAGPKFCGCHESESLIKYTLNERDAREIGRYLALVSALSPAPSQNEAG